MVKHFTHKLALMGCVSTCLFSFASFAAETADKDDPLVFTQTADAQNIVCGSGAAAPSLGDEQPTRTLTYEVTNKGFLPVRLKKPDIEIDDQFDPDLTMIDDKASTCKNNKLLFPGKSCEIVVLEDPTTVDCDPNSPITSPNEVERELVVKYKTIFPDFDDRASTEGFIREIETDIDFDVTVTGYAETFSLLAVEEICEIDSSSTESKEISCVDEAKLDPDGPIQVFQNTGSKIDVTDNIYYHSPAVEITDPDLLDAALSDATQAYINITNICPNSESVGVMGCNRLDEEDLEKHVVTPAIYHLAGHDKKITGTMTFRGRGDFIIVLDSDDDYAFGCPEDSWPPLNQQLNYVLEDGAEASNIYWIGGNIELCNGAGNTMPGTIITGGQVYTGNDQNSDIPLSLDGRIFVINPPCPADTVCKAPPSPSIALEGNSINGTDDE